MKSLIVYYSYTGNTEQVAYRLVEMLKSRGEVVIRKLEPLDEARNFFMQCLQAASGRKAELRSVVKRVSFNISEYDLICIGTPVWAFAPTPAINAYLDRLTGAEGKKAVVFTTFGSGTGVGRCVNTITKRLANKGVTSVKKLNIQQDKVKDAAFIEKEIKGLGL